MFDALEKRLRKDGHERPELINELYQGDLKDYVKCLEVGVPDRQQGSFRKLNGDGPLWDYNIGTMMYTYLAYSPGLWGHAP